MSHGHAAGELAHEAEILSKEAKTPGFSEQVINQQLQEYITKNHLNRDQIHTLVGDLKADYGAHQQNQKRQRKLSVDYDGDLPSVHLQDTEDSIIHE